MALNFDDIQDESTQTDSDQPQQPQQANQPPIPVNLPGSQQLNPEPQPTQNPSDQSTTPQPSSMSFDSMPDETAQYSTPGQIAITAAEGAAQGAVGPLAPLTEEALGVPSQDILNREKANPWTHRLSEGAGLAGTAAASFGLGAVLPAAGAAAEGLVYGAKAAEAAGVAADAVEASEGAEAAATAAGVLGPVAQDTSLGTAIGHSALKGAVEMSILQGSDELSKMVLKDPDQTAESAIANVGLAAATGGVLGGAGTLAFKGAISPLWQATAGRYLDNKLSAVAIDQAAGLRNADNDPLTMHPILKHAFSIFLGVTPTDLDGYLNHFNEIRSLPSYSDLYDQAADHIGAISNGLEDGTIDRTAGPQSFKQYVTSLNTELRLRQYDAKEANNLTATALKDAQTKLASDIQGRAFDVAPQISQAVENLRQNVIDGSSSAYDVLDKSESPITLKPLYSQAEKTASELEEYGTPEAKLQAQKIRNYATGIQEMYPDGAVAGTQAKKLIQGLDQVSKYDYNSTTFDKGLSQSYKQLRYTLDSTLKNTIPEYADAMKPVASDTELLKNLSAWGDDTKIAGKINGLKKPAQYNSSMPLLKQLETRTGVQFTQDLEPYLNKDLQESLKQSLPEYAEAQKTAEDLHKLKDPHYKQALIEAMNKQTFSHFPGFEDKSLSEMMELYRLQSAFAKTATHGSRHVLLYSELGAPIMNLITKGAVSGLEALGPGAVIGAAIDKVGPRIAQKIIDKYATHFGDLGDESGATPGIVKRVLAKVIESKAPPNGSGFKAAADYIAQAEKAQKTFKVASEKLLSPGDRVLTASQLPDPNHLMKLDKLVAKYTPQPQMPQANLQLAHYMPDHQQSLTQASQNAIAYLQTLRPKSQGAAPFDRAVAPNASQKSRYNRALQIAQQPLMVMEFAKQGTLHLSDLQDLQHMYPNIYKTLQQKISDEVIKAKSKSVNMPYKTRMGTSLLLGAPLDSTMQQKNIMSAQIVQHPPQRQPQAQKSSKGPKSTGKLEESSVSAMTPSQATESRHIKGK